MELKPTDLILRRREAPSRRMAAGSVSLVAVLRDARNPSRRAPQVGHARLRMRSALLRTRYPVAWRLAHDRGIEAVAATEA
jgi:hypothetical protein